MQPETKLGHWIGMANDCVQINMSKQSDSMHRR